MDNDGNQIPHYKIVVLGNSGAGKTSIILRWISDQFAKDSKPTIGSNHQRKRVVLPSGPVDLFVWDTAGQEQFQALMPLYARSSALAIITASISDLDSFEQIPKWIETVKSSCDPCPPLILAINKMDLIDRMVYTQEEVNETYGDEFSATFFVSALSGENIDNLFSAAALEASNYSQKNQETELQPAQEKEKGCC